MTPRENGTREEATVAGVFYGVEDHGILTCNLDLALGDGGSRQGFGGLCLDDKSGPDFKRVLSEFFDKPFDAIKGSKCFALRCWEYDRIEGLELPNGKRFTLYRWRKKHWPNKTLTVLEERRESTRREIAFLERRLREERERLEKVAEGYVDWGDAVVKALGFAVLFLCLGALLIWFHWVGECEARGGTVRGNIISHAQCVWADK